MGSLSAPNDGELAALAGRLRVLTQEQLLAAGLTMRAIVHRVDQGRLRRLWRGVYLVVKRGGGKSVPPTSTRFSKRGREAGFYGARFERSVTYGSRTSEIAVTST